MSWISVDPGISGTGVAVWDDDKQVPTWVVPMKHKTKDEYMAHFNKLFNLKVITHCVCENATYFQGDDRGEVTLRSGKLIKLAQFIGGIQEVCRANHVTVELVTPQKWKGQLPKRITIKKVMQHWPSVPFNPKKESDSHMFDAIAIGMWKLGLL